MKIVNITAAISSADPLDPMHLRYTMAKAKRKTTLNDDIYNCNVRNESIKS